MDVIQLFTVSLGGSLFCMGWLLTSGNWSSWKNPQVSNKSQEEAALIMARSGRRINMSVALMGLGGAVALGAFLGRERITTIYWYGVVALALWMSILAIVDGGATWSYVIRVRRRLEKKRETILAEATNRARQAIKDGSATSEATSVITPPANPPA